MNYTLSGDDAILSALRRLNGDLSDLSDERDDAIRFLAVRLDERFQNTASLLPALAPSTVKARQSRARRTGKKLVAAIDTPLRAFADSIRLAAIATTDNVIGSAFEKSNAFAQSTGVIGVASDAPSYMERALLGGATGRERNAVELPDSDPDDALSRMEARILSRLNGYF